MNPDRDLIRDLRGRQIYDSRGNPTVEVEVELKGGSRASTLRPHRGPKVDCVIVTAADPTKARAFPAIATSP